MSTENKGALDLDAKSTLNILSVRAKNAAAFWDAMQDGLLALHATLPDGSREKIACEKMEEAFGYVVGALHYAVSVWPPGS